MMCIFTTDTSVVFTASNFNAFESTGTLVVTLESSGTIKLQSFTIYVIAEADNSTIFPATGNVSNICLS